VNFKMYSRSAKGGEKEDPNCKPWLAKDEVKLTIINCCKNAQVELTIVACVKRTGIGYGYQYTYPIRRRFTRSTCYRRNVSKDATSRFGSNENIFPVCQSFETFHLVDSKCFGHFTKHGIGVK
jgi:hypothetical protein